MEYRKYSAYDTHYIHNFAHLMKILMYLFRNHSQAFMAMFLRIIIFIEAKNILVKLISSLSRGKHLCFFRENFN